MKSPAPFAASELLFIKDSGLRLKRECYVAAQRRGKWTLLYAIYGQEKLE